MKETIRNIWKDELSGVDPTDNDDFFELGGHSAIMIRIQSRLLSDHSLSIRMDQLMENSTISSLSDFIQTNLSELTVENESTA